MAEGDERTRETDEHGLTHEEVAEVLARAAELDAGSGSSSLLPELVMPSVVEEAAVEAGLSRQAVRQALAELVAVRPGLPQGATPEPTDDTLTVVRRVPGEVGAVQAEVERYLRRQVFGRQRIFESGSRWVPRTGVAASIRRTVDPGGHQHLEAVRSVDVQVVADPVREGHAVVRLDLDITTVRHRRTGVVAGGAATGAAVGGGLVVLNGIEMILLGAPVGVGIAAAGWWGGRQLTRRSVLEIDVGVNGFLDRLEHGTPSIGRPRGGD